MIENRENQALKKCLSAIESKLEWKDAYEWVHNDFQELSHVIHQETKVLLSTNTLKRLWGKIDYEGHPSITTKNALAKYLGFSNWKEYLSHVLPVTAKQKTTRKGGYFVTVVIAIVIIALSLFLLIRKNNPNEFNGYFKLKDSIGVVPFTIHYQYDIKNYPADSFYIYHQWGHFQTLDPEKNLLTILHFIPNYYKVYLIGDDDTLARTNYHIKTTGWVFYYPSNTYKPRYYVNLNTHSGILHLKQQQLDSLQIDIREGDHWVNYSNFRSFGNNDSTLRINSRLRNTLQHGGMTCQDCLIRLNFEQYDAQFHFTQPGCTKYADVTIADMNINGNENDMSEFGINFEAWQELTIDYSKKRFTVSNNTDTIYHSPEFNAPGELKGIQYWFRGLGEVDELNMISGSDTIYSEGF